MRTRLITGLGLAAALFALAACRSSPDVAAYVGDRAITEQQITTLTDGYNEKAPDDRKVTRAQVVQYVVHDELCERLRQDTGLTYEPQAVAEGSPELVTLAGRVESCLNALPTTGAASEEEMRALFDRAKASGRFPADATFEDARQELQSEEAQGALARQRTLTEAAEKADLLLNPRYGEVLNMALNPQFANPLGDAGAAAVVDRPAPAPAGTPGQ